MPKNHQVPSDNYTAADRQMIRLRQIAARADAEKLIAEKFDRPWPDIFEQTSLFENGTPPELRAYEEWLDLQHLDQEREQVAANKSLWHRLVGLFRR